MKISSPARFSLLVIFAVAAGALIGYVDSRPTWDDTGVTAGAVFLSTALFGGLMPSRAYVWALLVGGTIVVIDVSVNGGFGALLALCIAFAGSYTGAFVRRMFGSSTTPSSDNH